MATLLLQRVMATLTKPTQQVSKHGLGGSAMEGKMRLCHRKGLRLNICPDVLSVLSLPSSRREGSRLDRLLQLRPCPHHCDTLHRFGGSAVVPAHKGQSCSTPEASPVPHQRPTKASPVRHQRSKALTQARDEESTLYVAAV